MIAPPQFSIFIDCVKMIIIGSNIDDSIGSNCRRKPVDISGLISPTKRSIRIDCVQGFLQDLQPLLFTEDFEKGGKDDMPAAFVPELVIFGFDGLDEIAAKR